MADLITNTSQNTSYDPFLKGTLTNLVTSAVNEANTPYTPYTGQRIAQMSPDELKAYESLRSGYMQEMPMFQQAQGVYNQGLSQLDQARTMQQWNPQAAQQYMNPYISSVVQNVMGEANRQNQQQLSALRGQQAMSGSFGGSRAAISEQELLNNANRTTQGTLANLMSQGYDTARDQFGRDRDFGANLSGMYAQQAAGLTGLAGAQQGYRSGEIENLRGVGSNIRSLAQANLDTRYQDFQNQQGWDKGQLSYLSSILSGNPLSNFATGQTGNITPVYPQASGAQQLIGGLTSGLGLVSNLGNAFGSLFGSTNKKARGGLVNVEGYAEGGLTGSTPINRGRVRNPGRYSYEDPSYENDPALMAWLKENISNPVGGSLARLGRGIVGLFPDQGPGEMLSDAYSAAVAPAGMPGIAAAPVVSTPNEQPTYEAITLNGTPVGLAGVGDTYAPTKIPSPGEQYNPLGGNKQRSGGTSLADLFTPHEPSWAEQLGEANPLLMTGLAMLGANAANNPYDGWAQMANAAGGALSEYEKLRQGREALRTQRQGAIADAANATTRNAIERERNQVLQAQKQQELLAEANDPMRYIEMQKAQMDMAKTRADIQRINAALQARQMTQAEAQAVQTLLDTAAKQGVDYSLEDALAIVRGGMGASLPGSMGITSTNVQE